MTFYVVNDGFPLLVSARRAMLEALSRGLAAFFPETCIIPDRLLEWPALVRPTAGAAGDMCWWACGVGPQDYDGVVCQWLVAALRTLDAGGKTISHNDGFLSQFVTFVVDIMIQRRVSIVQGSAILACVEQNIVGADVRTGMERLNELVYCWDPSWFSQFLYFSYCPVWSAGEDDAMSPLWNPAALVNHVSDELSFPTMTISLFWRYSFELLSQFVDDYCIDIHPDVKRILYNCRSGLATRGFMSIVTSGSAFQQSAIVTDRTFPYCGLALLVEDGMPSWSVPGTEKVLLGASGSQPAGERDRTTAYLLSECMRWYSSCYDMARKYVSFGKPEVMQGIDGTTLNLLLTRYALSDGANRVRDLFLVAVKQISKVRQASTVLFGSLRAKNSKWGGSTKNIDIIRALLPEGLLPQHVAESVKNDIIMAVQQRRAAKTIVSSERKDTRERRLRQQQRGSSAMLRHASGKAAQIIKSVKAEEKAKEAEEKDDVHDAKRKRVAGKRSEAAVDLDLSRPPSCFHMGDYLRQQRSATATAEPVVPATGVPATTSVAALDTVCATVTATSEVQPALPEPSPPSVAVAPRAPIKFSLKPKVATTVQPFSGRNIMSAGRTIFEAHA